MNIQEISAIQSPARIKEEVAKMAIKRNCTADEIWTMINGFRKTQEEGRRPRIPIKVKDILKYFFPAIGIKITESPMEDLLKYELLARHINFETQANIGKYKVDFLFPQARLVVEADGKEYHSTQKQRDNDFKRELALMKKGYLVLRFKGSEIYRDVVGCVNKIEDLLNMDSKK